MKSFFARMQQCWLVIGICLTALASIEVQAFDRWNWAEGSAGGEDGATREFYNAAALLRWRNPQGDWRDRKGVAQGRAAFAELSIASGNADLPVVIDVTALVTQWLSGAITNRGMLLQVGTSHNNDGAIRFASRENPDSKLRPELVLRFGVDSQVLLPVADTSLDPSTYKSKGKSAVLTVSVGEHHALLQFDLSALRGRHVDLQKAELRLTAIERLGGTTLVQVFVVDIPVAAPLAPQSGLASQFVLDAGIDRHPEVIYATSFDDATWADAWQEFRGHYALVTRADQFEPLAGQALQVRVKKGDNYGATGSLKFMPLLGTEPEQMYVRYYLRFGNNWRPRVEGGKLPGFAGTYGKGGWGGRPNDGRNGWSARGAFSLQIPEGNPLAGRTPIGSYIYEADESSIFGARWVWSEGEGAYLENNRWYCVEQFLRLNTPGQHDGVIQAWLDGREVLHRRNLRIRLVPELKIEKFWFDIYHGGTAVSPYDQDLYFDNLVVARRYIGPLAVPAAGSGHTGTARH